MVCELTRRDWTILKLSEATGISRNTLTAVKNGKSCTKSTATAIANAFGIPLDELKED
jgi:transcriptional regulator with XRE-family HTH domain